MIVAPLSSAQAEEIVTVFCDAFHDYPVMRHVLGAGDRYDTRLRTLIRWFVNGRVFRKEPLLGIRDDAGRLTGAATMTLPESPDPPAVLPTGMRSGRSWGRTRGRATRRSRRPPSASRSARGTTIST